MDLGIKGKHAFVLGGGSGIGRGIAEALAAEGVHVTIASRNMGKLEETAARIRQSGGHAMPVQLDLADLEATKQAFKQAADECGGFDILVNNTGGPPQTDVLDTDEQQWSRQFDAMVLSLFSLTSLAVPVMRERKWGRIITVASVGVVQPNPHLAISNVMRSALVAWSKSLANEVACDGITANVLLPATTRTERIIGFWKAEAEKTGKSMEELEATMATGLPTRRMGTIEEFGAVAAFIASIRAGYITGSMIRVDGGFLSTI